MRSNFLLLTLLATLTVAGVGCDQHSAACPSAPPPVTAPLPTESVDAVSETLPPPADQRLRDSELPPDVDVASLKLFRDLAEAWSHQPASPSAHSPFSPKGQ
ncbi:MAG: hypothetical protein SFV23_07610 [Planctomycetaceae bacterium]|nr:hypothetical protein [Planctomycetaceae bacterium]